MELRYNNSEYRVTGLTDADMTNLGFALSTAEAWIAKNPSGDTAFEMETFARLRRIIDVARNAREKGLVRARSDGYATTDDHHNAYRVEKVSGLRDWAGRPPALIVSEALRISADTIAEGEFS